MTHTTEVVFAPEMQSSPDVPASEAVANIESRPVEVQSVIVHRGPSGGNAQKREVVRGYGIEGADAMNVRPLGGVINRVQGDLAYSD